MPQAPHTNDPSNRKSHKKGKKRHRNEEDEVVEKKSKKVKHAQDGPPKRSQVCSIDSQHGQLNK